MVGSGSRVLLPLLALTAGCTAGVGSPAFSTAMLAPSPPGWFAFCAQAGGSAADCDPVPAAVAMPDGASAMTPEAWRGYCRRHREDVACGR